MRKLASILVLLAAAMAPRSSSAQQAQKPTQKDVLPDRFGGWTGSTIASEGELSDSAQQAAAEAGLETVEAKRYAFDGKTTAVRLKAFRDPTGAYEIYTSQLNTGMNPSTLGPLTAVNDEKLVALVGNLLLTVEHPRDVSEADLQALLQSVKRQATTSPLPPIRTYLVHDGMIDGTQRYALGKAGFANALRDLQVPEFAALAPEVRFEAGAEAMMARYQHRNNSAVLLLLEYPTPQFAEQQIHHLETALPAKDGKIERKGSLLSLVLKPTSAEYAENLRAGVNYETQVTWNEPSHTLTDPPWLLVIKNIFIGTMVFCVIAVVLGVAFGGVRVLTKRFFPGKVFDRPQDMEILQLGLSGKRIDPSDFY